MNDDFDNSKTDKEIHEKFMINYQCPFCGFKTHYDLTYPHPHEKYCARCLVVHDQKIEMKRI